MNRQEGNRQEGYHHPECGITKRADICSFVALALARLQLRKPFVERKCCNAALMLLILLLLVLIFRYYNSTHLYTLT